MVDLGELLQSERGQVGQVQSSDVFGCADRGGKLDCQMKQRAQGVFKCRGENDVVAEEQGGQGTERGTYSPLSPDGERCLRGIGPQYRLFRSPAPCLEEPT